MKKCSACQEPRPLEEFSNNRSQKDGKSNNCKPCQSEANRRYRARHADRVSTANARYRDANRKQHRSSSIAWAALNRDRGNAARARGRASEFGARVSNDPRIQTLYSLARKLNEAGRDPHVDHIVPFAKGGHHEFENLQILTAHDNLVKGSR